MSKKKIFAIILFIFMSLYMFTFANPGKDIEEIPEGPEETEKEPETKPVEKPEEKPVVIDHKPVVNINPVDILILAGSNYDLTIGVNVVDDLDVLTAIPNITTTTLLNVGNHKVTYTATDRSGNVATNIRNIRVLDPKGDDDNDGFTNEEEIKNPQVPTDPTKPKDEKNPLVPGDKTDPLDKEKHPETYMPTINLKGESPITVEVNTKYVDLGVDVILDSHDKLTDIKKDLIIDNKVNINEVGQYTVTYSITDRYNKTVKVTRIVNVVDTTKPVITLNELNVYELEVKGVKPEFKALATDNYDKVVNVVITDNIDVNKVGKYTVTFTATDANNNKEVITKDFIVKDTTKPVIIINPIDVLILEGRDYDLTTGVTATDNIDEVIAISDIKTTTLLNAGNHKVTYTATDRSGNVATNIRNIRVLDPKGDDDNDGFTNEEEMENPQVPTDSTKPKDEKNPLVPGDKTDPLDKEKHPETYMPTINLKGESPITVEVNTKYVDLGVDVILDSHDKLTDIKKDLIIDNKVNINEVGQYTVTYSITDRYNKTVKVTRIVNVVDTTSPIIKLKGNSIITILRESKYVDLGVQIIDNYDKNLNAIIDTKNLDVNKLGTYTITYNATDSNGNKAQEVTRTVIVARNDWDKTIKSLTAVLEKHEYKRLEAMSNIAVTRIDNDNTITILAPNDYVLTGFDTKTVTETSRNITVVHDNLTATDNYTVVRNDKDKTLLKIVATLTKTEFKRFEELSTLKVMAYDNDGTTYDVTALSNHNFDSTKAVDKKELKVTYRARESIVLYTVVRNDEDKTIKSLTAVLEKDIYKRLETMSNIVVTRTDNDNTITILAPADYVLTGFDTATITNASRAITVVHDNLTATDNYTVVRNDEDKTIKSLTAVLEKDVYKRLETMSNIVVTRTDNDNTITILSPTDYVLTGFDTATITNASRAITVVHDNLTATDNYTVVRNDEDKTIKSLTAVLEKDIYKKLETMSNIVVTRTDKDGTKTVLTPNDYVLTGFDTTTITNTPGTITVTHDNLTATDNYTVVRNDWDKTIKSLTAVLEKHEYKRLEAMSNIVVTRTDNDNTITILAPTDYILSGFDTTIITNEPRTITVGHDKLIATDSYTVVRNDEDKKLESLTAVLEKDVYKKFETMSNIVVTRIDKDGTKTVLTPNDYVLTGFDTTTITNTPRIITIKYNGLEATDSYTVVRNDWDKTIKSLTAVLEKHEYKRLEAMSNIIVTRTDNDNTTTILAPTDYVLTGFDTTTITNEPRTITIVHDSLTATDNYTVIKNELDKELKEVRLSTIPNGQLLFQVNSNVLINDYIIVTKIYNDNTEEITTVYSVNNFTTQNVGKYMMSVTVDNITSNNLEYKIIEKPAYPTKFEVSFNNSKQYRKSKSSCTTNCDSEGNTRIVKTNYNFLEVVEHYDENISLSSVKINYTNVNYNENAKISEKIRWSRISGATYDPVRLITTNRGTNGWDSKPDNIMDAEHVIDTIEIKYSRRGYGEFNIIFKYNPTTNVFKAITETKIY